MAKRSTDADAATLLQTLLATPLGSSNERHGPVSLHAVETPRYSISRRYVASTWFDTFLQRSSQLLFVSALLVLGYWFVNVPLSNWLHAQNAPSVRAAVLRIPTAKPTMLVSNASPNAGQLSAQNDRTVSFQRASTVPSATSAAAQASAPRATGMISSSEQFHSPALGVKVVPTTIPEPTGAPFILSPTITPSPPMIAFSSPTITPVALGIVSKPSPAPIARPILPPITRDMPTAARKIPTRLLIPALGLDVTIKEVFIVGNQWEIAKYAAGYLNGSGLPGVPGNLALDGHAGLYGGVFANLGALSPGDEIYVDAAGVRYRYRLRQSNAVWPNQTDVLDTTETPTMTLITCTNWDTQRLVAIADFVDSSPAIDA